MSLTPVLAPPMLRPAKRFTAATRAAILAQAKSGDGRLIIDQRDLATAIELERYAQALKDRIGRQGNPDLEWALREFLRAFPEAQ